MSRFVTIHIPEAFEGFATVEFYRANGSLFAKQTLGAGRELSATIDDLRMMVRPATTAEIERGRR